MKPRSASTTSSARLCATCLVLVGRHGNEWRHIALVDRSRFDVCNKPSPGRPAKAYEVARGHGQPIG